MKRHLTPFREAKGRRVALFVCLLLVATCVSAWLPLGVGRAQDGGAAQAQPPGQERVIVRTVAGDVVTSSAGTPSELTVSGLERLSGKYPGTWRVDLNAGAVKNLKPEADVPVASAPKNFSRDFLEEFSGLFGIAAGDAGYIIEFNLRERRLVEYRQEVGGVPVEYSFLTFSVVDAKLEQVTSRLYPDAGARLEGVTPSVGKDEALDTALADVRGELAGVEAGQVKREGDLVILPLREDYRLSWKVVVSSSSSLASYTFYIDAVTGKILKKFSNLMSQENTTRAQSQTPRGLSSLEEASAVINTTLTRKETGEGAGAAQDADKGAGARQQSQSTPAPAAAWQYILSENFDVVNFPYSPWRAFDNNGATGGELYWDDQNCVYNDPSWSLWAADGGANSLNACTNNYANSMDSWVVYGPFDLSNSTDGLLDFHYNNVSELNFDYFRWMVSVNGTNFYGYQTSGNSGGWQYGSLDFKNVPTLGNILGRTQVWIAFTFTSDGSIASGKGAFVDDVAVKKMTGACTGVSGHVGGHIYGRNKNELQLSNFKNMKVVLDKTLATDAHAVTNASGNYSSTECSDRIRFELEGYGSQNFVKVRDCNGGGCPFGGDTLASPDFNFSSVVSYDWNEDEDDKKEVNVFWHVNEIHDWYRTLLGQDLMNYQMQAHIDYVDNTFCGPTTNNAFYNGDGNMYFCPSDLSRESDVIYHEYTHGVVGHIPNYTLPYFDEGGAINEGIADYFAAAKNGDPAIGEGVGTIRTITNVVNYGSKCVAQTSACGSGQYWLRSTAPVFETNDNGYVHHNSLVPSGALWDLRQNRGLSASFVDRLVMDTLILRRPLSYNELLSGLVAQDGGAHESQIRAAFATRGVGTPSITVGQGAPNPQLFVDAFNRNSLSQYVIMPPVNAVHRWDCSTCSTANSTWGKGLIQDFNDVDGVSHDALMLADTNTSFVALVYGGMWTKFSALGGVNYDSANNRILGYPVADRNCSDFNAACFTDSQLVSPFGTSYHYQRFQGGALVMHRNGAKSGQTYEVHGAIRTTWQELGGPGAGSYGLPVTDEYAWQSKRRSDFEGGSICFNPSTNQTEPGCTTPPAQVSVTVQTSPSGRSFTVDGVAYASAQTFTWTSGSSHTVATTSPQNGATGTRYVFGSWSDGGAASHTVAPTSNATYTANFTTQYFLTTSAGSGGTVSPASNWYNSGQSVAVTATPNSGFSFTGWTGSGSGSFTGATNPVNVTMNGPVSETAGFTQNAIQVTVQTNPSGRTYTVDGTAYSAAQTFFWTPGSGHTIATTSPQSGGTGTQYVWGGWSDGGAISHTVAPTGGTTYTANFTKQYFLTMSAGSGGTVSPASQWVNSGSAVSISATPGAGFAFAGWSGSGTGSYTGASNPASVTMNGPVTETASFTQTNVTSGLQYYPLAHPVRLLDTRAGQAACYTPGVPLNANATRTQAAAGTCEGLVIPSNARAVVGNAAVVNNLTGAGAGYVTLYPSGVAKPVAANVNYTPGQVVSNGFTVGLGPDGAFNIYAYTKLDIVVDITGYYAPPGTGGLYYHPLPKPVRLLDTRIGQTACDAPGSPVVGGSSRNEAARTTCGGVVIPNDAKAVAGNVAVINTLAGAGSGHVTIYPGGVARPVTANVNYLPGQVVSNAFNVGLGSDGTFNIYAYTTLDVVVDVSGYYSASAAADANGMPGLLYYPLASPMRLLDTRAGQPACYTPGLPLGANAVRTQNARLTCGSLTVPASAAAVVGNAAVVNTLTGAGAGHVILYPSGVARPLAANVNYTPGQVVSNAFTVGLGADGAFNIYTYTALDFVTDISGYFAP